MGAVSRVVRIETTKIDGSFSLGPEVCFRPQLVGDVCRAIWGPKADEKVAAICGVSSRAVRDYFNGRVAIPSLLLSAINFVLTNRPQ